MKNITVIQAEAVNLIEKKQVQVILKYLISMEYYTANLKVLN